MRYLYTVIIMLPILMFSGCGNVSDQPSASPAAEPATSASSGSNSVPTEKTYVLPDLAPHSTAEDCWLAIGGSVYDMTPYVGSHPGGKTILAGCGKDATAMFETKPTGRTHSDRARAMLADYYIGRLVE